MGASAAVKEYEVEAAPGIHRHWAVYGEDVAVDTAPHPEIETPPTLKSTTPGTDAVAVIVSIEP